MENADTIDTLENFDVPRLLNIRGLDIRGIAEKNESLSTDEYFLKLGQFMEEAPQIAEKIATIPDNGVDEDMLRYLVFICDLMKDVGLISLSFDISVMLDVVSSKNLVASERYAKLMTNDINKISQQLKLSHTTKKSLNAKNGKSSGQKNTDETLKAHLERLDYEENNRKMRVLIVDDTLLVHKMVSNILYDHYEVFSLTKGTQLEKFLEHNTPELFLLDILMPVISGYDLVPIIRKFEEHKDTPIIFLTGKATPDHLMTAVSLGASDFIAKPVNPQVLLDKIAKKIVRKRAY